MQDAFKSSIKKSLKTDQMQEKIREFFTKKQQTIEELFENNFFLLDEKNVIKSFMPNKARVFNSNTKPVRISL